MIEAFPPQHMDIWSRNERLYQTLLGMGVYVTPIFTDQERTRIDYLHVACAAPSYALPVEQPPKQSAEAPVDLAVQRAEVGRIVGAAECDGGNVVDFPSVRG